MKLTACYPSFLKQKPKVWGMSIQDMLLLSIVLFVLTQIGIPDFVIIVTLIALYFAIIGLRRLYPRRHFEFAFITKNHVYMKDINEKLSL